MRSSTLATFDDVSTTTETVSPVFRVVELSETHNICGGASAGSMRIEGVGAGAGESDGAGVGGSVGAGAGESDGAGVGGGVSMGGGDSNDGVGAGACVGIIGGTAASVGTTAGVAATRSKQATAKMAARILAKFDARVLVLRPSGNLVEPWLLPHPT